MRASDRNRRLMPLVIVSALVLMGLDAAGFAPISGLRRSALSLGQPIGTVLAVAVAPLSGTWNGAVHYDDVVDENHVLRRRVAELEGAVAGQADIETELRALMEATEIDYLGDVERVTARVVADRRTAMERIVEIDKGAEAGVSRGMPVVTGAGLVGIIELVTDDRSVVRLISDGMVAVGVRSRHGLGLAVGDRGARLRLSVSPELHESIRLGAVVDGERFVTSGIDRSVYPAGIPVGTLAIPSDPAIGPGDRRKMVPAGPSRLISGDANRTPEPGELFLEPVADIELLGYLSVLLVEPPA